MKSLRDIYLETKTRIVCYMSMSDDMWIKEVWKYEKEKDHYSVKREVEEGWRNLGDELTLGDGEIWLNGERKIGRWKRIKDDLKKRLKERIVKRRKETLAKKKLQGKGFAGLDEYSHKWLNCNVDPRKVSSIIQMQERMVETRNWKKIRGIEVDSEMCRLLWKIQRDGRPSISRVRKISWERILETT